jgi:hypothetical protein
LQIFLKPPSLVVCCLSKLKTTGITVLLKLREHEFGGNPGAIAKTNFVNKIKDAAITSTDTACETVFEY